MERRIRMDKWLIAAFALLPITVLGAQAPSSAAIQPARTTIEAASPCHSVDDGAVIWSGSCVGSGRFQMVAAVASPFESSGKAANWLNRRATSDDQAYATYLANSEPAAAPANLLMPASLSAVVADGADHAGSGDSQVAKAGSGAPSSNASMSGWLLALIIPLFGLVTVARRGFPEASKMSRLGEAVQSPAFPVSRVPRRRFHYKMPG